MARIAGVDLPGRKHVHIALRYIFGIGPKISMEICKLANIEPTKKADDLDENEVRRIREADRPELQGRG
jgi:small subunit ribosomal protein S13